MTKTNLMLIGVLLAVSLACGTTNNSAASKSNSMVGSWAISATNGVGGQSVFQVNLISSPCTVSTPVGTFAVAGSSCSIADDNTGQGSISGTGSFFFPPQGVLIGGSSSGQIDGVFVEADQYGDFAVIDGKGTLSNGAISGTWTCNSGTAVCFGLNGTFSGNKQ
jgi:hypothetical protein